VTNHGNSPRAPREEALAGLYKLARDWLKDAPGATSPTAQTPAYVDLIFAFGLARLGEGDAARDLLARARLALGDKDEAHRLLCGAFEYRVRQALDGKPHTGPLPDDHLVFGGWPSYPLICLGVALPIIAVCFPLVFWPSRHLLRKAPRLYRRFVSRTGGVTLLGVMAWPSLPPPVLSGSGRELPS
jgi:hypothetical protein